MPLLNKKPFVRNKVNLNNLKDTDQLFYCTQTGEAFEDYEEFCERVYLCNSIQWSCSYTGKSSLTYKEALDSEENAKKMLKEFPMELRLPILYLATLTDRTTQRELADDILAFVRNRFFVGEMVEVQIDNQWKESHILQVHLPKDLKKAAAEFEKSNNNPRKFFPPESMFEYEVEVLTDSTSAVMNKDALVTVPLERIRRKKFVHTQEKNRLFIRQFVECPSGKGACKVKDSVYKKYNLGQTQWSKIFVGPEPKFYQQPMKPTNTNTKANTSNTKANTSNSANTGKRKPTQQPTLDHFVTKKSSPTKVNNVAASKENPANSKAAREAKEKEMAEKMEKKRITLEEIAKKQKEEKMQLQEKKKQEKIKLAEFMKEYQKKKDDLELEDLKELPEPAPIHMKIPNKYFGHLVQLLEFAGSFDKFVGSKRFFPKGNAGSKGSQPAGLSFELLEKALLDSEVEGPLNDLLQMLLSAVYHVLELEEEEMDDSSKSRYVLHGSIDKTITESSDPDVNRLSDLATKAKHWALHTQGVHFPQIPVDFYTITEVLRLHLLLSGSRMEDFILRWRYEQRGGYRAFDDPGVLFRQKRPDIMEHLAVKSVYELSLDDKLEIIQVLVDQVLTYAEVRDVIDEKIEEARLNRHEFRMNCAAVMRKEREDVFKLKEQKKNIKEKDKLDEIDREIAELVERNKDKLQREYIRLTVASREPRLLALGYDRAFRRYWVFQSVPGLYVEHNPEHYVGECIPGGTPCIDKMNMPDADTLEYLKRLFEDSNNKENLGNRTLVKDVLSTPVKNLMREGVNTDEKPKPRVAWVCSGQMSTCQVHNVKPGQTVWFYYKTEEDINRLISTLNDRGFREHELKDALTQERDRILKGLPDVPFFVYNPAEVMDVDSIPTDSNHGMVLDLALRDQLLDLEYKITAGGLGNLKVDDVGMWRKRLEEGNFDEKKEAKWPNEDKIPEIPEQEHDSMKELLETEFKFADILGAVFDSVASVASNIQGLKVALLQLEQCVTGKFFEQPLGGGKTSRRAAKVSNLAPKWEASLKRCTSLSQLFIHLATLEKSIRWSKSLLKTNCKLCKTRSDPEQMLLCDSCDKGFHTFCLTPKLKKIPEGDWHCAQCKPVEKTKAKAKKLAAAKPAEPVEEETKTVFGKCKVCLDKVPLITCAECSGGYHMACLEPPMRKIPRGKWTCQACRRLSAVMRREAEEEEGEALLRSSHRRCARAASSKISHIAQQILSNNLSDDESMDGNTSVLPPERKRKSRHSVEPVASDLPLDNAVLQEILEELMHDQNAWPFLRPVSKGDVPDYHRIILHPMDFGTIKHKLNMFQYRNNSEVLYDCNLVFDNCFAYNKEDSEIYESGDKLKTLFDKLCKERHLFYIEEDMSPDTKQAKKRKK
uniref:Bromodomain adjacent to zinc finger domain protein 1A n=1 Tax=Cacopsylla melanoneura TaxID=428564 RepID=A0A8D8PWH5_9HEMI